MDDAPHLPARLRAAGLRVTAPRLSVYGVLDAARADGGHLTAAEVAGAARARTPGISTQAVYDCLEALTRSGLARRIEPAGRPALFEARVGDNHHHLVCRGCGFAVDVDCTHGTAPCLTPAVAHGFVVDEAEVVFWGLCAGCAGAPAGADADADAGVAGTGVGTEVAAGPRARAALARPSGRTLGGPVGATRAAHPSRAGRHTAG